MKVGLGQMKTDGRGQRAKQPIQSKPLHWRLYCTLHPIPLSVQCNGGQPPSSACRLKSWVIWRHTCTPAYTPEYNVAMSVRYQVYLIFITSYSTSKQYGSWGISPPGGSTFEQKLSKLIYLIDIATLYRVSRHLANYFFCRLITVSVSALLPNCISGTSNFYVARYRGTL